MTDKEIFLKSSQRKGMFKVDAEQFCDIFNGYLTSMEQRLFDEKTDSGVKQVTRWVYHNCVIQVENEGKNVRIGDLLVDGRYLYISVTLGVNPFSECEDKHECAIMGMAFVLHEGAFSALSFETVDVFQIYRRCGACRPVAGYDGRYYVSQNGFVFSTIRGRSKKAYLTPLNASLNRNKKRNKHGYRVVALYRTGKDGKWTVKRYYVHRLVAMMFIPNPNELPEVNHKDENHENNSLENLEWITHVDNVHYGNHGAKVSAANTGKHRGEKETNEREIS